MLLDQLVPANNYVEASKKIEEALYQSTDLPADIEKTTQYIRQKSPTVYTTGVVLSVSFKTFRDRQIQYKYRDVSTRIDRNTVYLEYKWQLY